LATLKIKAMKIRSFLLIAALMVATIAHGQKVAVGMFGGASNYSGDMTEEYNVFFNETRPAVGGVLRYNAHPFLTLRLGVTSAYISGTDENFASAERRLRNLSFRSHILEVAAIAEVNLIGYDVEYQKFSPYLFGGVAGFHFSPETLFEAEWVDLQPLGTEGQGTTEYPNRNPYSLYQVSIPFGLGAKVSLGSGLTLAAEVGARMTFTDYLDDVSTTYVDRDVLIIQNGELAYQLSNRTGELMPNNEPVPYGNGDPRGDPTNNDWYVMAGFTFTYTIGVPMGIDRTKSGCPTDW
jgi:hypothetical protein